MLPSNAPFSPEQQQALNGLLPAMNRDQALWLSGYFAAHSSGASGGAVMAGPGAASEAASASATVRPPSDLPLTVLFATESGNCEALADQTRALAKRRGFKATVMNLSEFAIEDLAKLENVMVVASTWGDGEPPDSAVEFRKLLMGDGAPALKKVRFSVCALGDTSYDQFCQFGKEIDERFEALGGERVADRVDCDVDYDDLWAEWAGKAFDGFLERAVDTGSVSSEQASAVAAVVAQPVIEPLANALGNAYGKKNPFPAPVIEKLNLNGKGSSKETIHIELSLEGSGLSYDAGDALALIPTNREHDVEQILEATGLSEEAQVKTKAGETTFGTALRHELDITALSKRIIEKYNALAQSEKLTELLDDKAGLSDYLWGRQIVDLLVDYPIQGLEAAQIAGLMRKLPPRLYSIASSIAMHPDEVHLTIGAVRYEAHGKERTGVASTHVADVLEVDSKVPVFIQPNKNFKLPINESAPVIMVGPGTGIAPFRSFIEERAAVGAKGKNWLIFGDQKSQTDYLYQLEWQQYAKDEVLTRMDTAFSRDQEKKVYVQHRMQENALEVWDWLENGAYFYVCGDASRMAHDVNEALIDCVVAGGRLKRDAAEAYVDDLRKKHRYQRDVY